MSDPKPYLLSLGAGLLVGIIYSMLNVRSPAPPVIALLGLLGMLLGEQVPTLAKRLLHGKPVTTAWIKKQCAPHVLGPLPTSAPRACRSDDEA
jgi:XapX domain-containing protein